MTSLRNKLNSRDGGFTLIELLIVMIIIGILAAITIPVFLNHRSENRQELATAILHQDYPQATVGKISYDGPNNNANYTGKVDFGDRTDVCTFSFSTKTMKCQNAPAPAPAETPAPSGTATSSPEATDAPTEPTATVTVTQTVTVAAN